MKNSTNFIYDSQNSGLSKLKRHDSFYATVIKETATGCILKLGSNNIEPSSVFAFGNYSFGDRVIVTVEKLFADGRLPRVSVDRVVEYAADYLECPTTVLVA